VVPAFIQERQVAHFYKANPEYGSKFAVGLGLKVDEVMKKAA